MEEVRYFKATDGQLFEDEGKCAEHEAVLDAVEEATRLILPKEHDTVDFSNGEGYIQLTKETRVKFIEAFLRLVERLHPSLYSMAEKNPVGTVGRYLCDSHSPIYKLYLLADQIDAQDRLWGQSYYRLHPGEGQSVVLAER